MKILRKLYKFFVNEQYRFNILASRGFYNHWSDEKYLKHKFKLEMGYELNLDNPQTFNEKLQWLKLHDRNPQYTVMVDKYKAKEYVGNIIGQEHIIPTLGVWDSPDEIDFDKLPNQFVLKCNHNSGLGMCICKDKNKLDIKKVKKELDKGLKQDYYLTNREWPYKNVPRKIIAEKYLGDNLQDYRIYCFSGIPRLIYSYTNKSNAKGLKPEPAYCDIYTPEWKPVKFRQKYPPKGNLVRPSSLQMMLKIARILSQDCCHLRVDFYELDQLYVGELTFFAGGGFSVFYPNEWNKKIGDLLKLPKGNNEYVE